MSIIAPNPSNPANPNPNPNATPAQAPAAIPGASPGAQWVEKPDDARKAPDGTVPEQERPNVDPRVTPSTAPKR